ncbi:hypothetical protein SOVF_091210, partial [Spinacia oleracea]
MWFLRFLNFSRKGFFFHGFSTAKASAINTQLSAAPRNYLGRSAQAYLSTLQEANNDVEKMPLAKSLASLVVESSPPGDVKDTDRPEMGRVGMKRLFEMRVKKRVKQQYMNGRFSDLFMKVVADPKTLMDAYNCIRVCSNIDVATWEDSVICFESLAEDLANGSKKVDSVVLAKLISTIEDKIEDHQLCEMIRNMFDAQVLNVEFGGFPKGQGLPQEGTLSPILMNIYLGLFDDEFHRMSMRYEALDSSIELNEKQPQSKLRSWFRRQIKCSAGNPKGCENSGVRLYSCRFMDEIFFAISGPKEASLSLKSEVQNYFQDCLHLDVNRNMEIVPCNHGQGVRFAGALLIRTIKDSPAVRVVHKLKEKVKLFALQKQEIWDAGTARIGKKCLAHGLRKVKESEIRHLSDNNSCLSKISCYRKSGMETDHWYKQLIKIWMQDLKKNAATNEEYILSKCIAEPALPPSLLESFYEFQRRVEEYNSSETDSLLSLLPSSGLSQQCETITKVIAPVNVIQKRLLRYGLVSDKGYSRAVHALILQDSSQIIDWFSG